jgi:diguanylate cyclase (GGDEF)-like protein
MSRAQNNRILIIDDNPDIHSDFRKVLLPAADSSALDALEVQMLGESTSNGGEPLFELHHAHQGESGAEMFIAAKLSDRPFFAVFVDMRMPPGWDGLRTIEAIRKVDSDATIVICTAYSDHSWSEIKPLVANLDKLLILKKPFDPIELRVIVQSLYERWELFEQARMRHDQLIELVAIRTCELEAERAKDKIRLDQLEEIVTLRTQELRKTALHDRLTGLPNRVQFYDRLLSAITQQNRAEPSNYAVMFIDFDRFKVINDSMGHEFGDKLLQSISERLRSVIDPFNETHESPLRALAARLGGDEFCILIEQYEDESVVMEISQRVLTALSRPYDLKGRQVHSTASIGITLSRFGYRNAEDVLRDADTAMYAAKSAGRDRAVLFDRSMHERAMRRMVLENDLRHAVDRGELSLLYQPIVSLNTSTPIGAEALLRWVHPKHGPISPVDFIPLAEETGLIVTVGAWVFEQAIRELMRTPDLGYLSINVARRQLVDPGFINTFDAILARTGVEPSRVRIEITESTLINDPERSAIVIDELRDRGLRVFLDDFGTGLSSLGALRRFPLDGMKLDRSFLDAQVFSRRAAAVIHSTMTLARDLDMVLIAEGVESFEQVALLQALGCEAAQGYLFARPMTADELRMSLRECLHAAA